MSQAFADFEFHAQDGDASGGTHASEKGHPTDGDGQRLQMPREIVRQGARAEGLSDVGCGLEIQSRMDVLVKTSLSHRPQFAAHLSGRMQRDRKQAFLQPAVELFDGPIAPRFVFGNEGEFDADQQSQTDEPIERTGMRGQAEQLAVVDLQDLRQTHRLPGADCEGQNRFQLGCRLKFDKNGSIVDIAVNQEKPLPPRTFQVARSDQVQLMALVAASDEWHRIRARTGTWLRSKRRRRSLAPLQDAFDAAQRWQRLVPQTSQLVTNRWSTSQTIALTRSLSAHQPVANLKDGSANFLRPAAALVVRSMRTISQPRRTFLQLAVPPFVKPFSTSLHMLTDPTDRPPGFFQPDRPLAQLDFLRHRSSSRKMNSISRRILSTISWRLAFPSVSTHLAVTCQHSCDG